MNLTRLRSSRFLVPGLALAAGMAIPAPAPAADCIRSFATCLVRASDFPTWWERSAAGIDCYLDSVACVRRVYG